MDERLIPYAVLGGLGGVGGFFTLMSPDPVMLYDIEDALIEAFCRDLWLGGVDGDPVINLDDIHESYRLFTSFYDKYCRWLEEGIRDGYKIGEDIADILLDMYAGRRAGALILNELFLMLVKQKFNIYVEPVIILK